MTMFYLTLDAESRQARWCGAGQDPAILYDPKTDTFDQLEGEDLPLGVAADWSFSELKRDGLKTNQVIVLGTDGIWECMNSAGEMFGKDRLNEVIRQNASHSAEDICQSIYAALTQFRGTIKQQDDITAVVVKFLPEAESQPV